MGAAAVLVVGLALTGASGPAASGGRRAHFELWTNTNGQHWHATDAFDPTSDNGCVEWPNACTGITLLRITRASAPLFGGKPGGIVFRTGIPHQVGAGRWQYESALFRVDGWPVRGNEDLHPVRIF
jgi:hypothetical protein